MTPPAVLRERLAAGSARGLGCANQVAHEAMLDRALLKALVQALGDPRPRVVTRAANALKKVQTSQPGALDALAPALIRSALNCESLEARWNLIAIVGKLPLKGRNRALAVDLLFESLNTANAWLRIHSLQALFDLSPRDPALQGRLRPALEVATAQGTPAMQARARRLLPALGRDPA